MTFILGVYILQQQAANPWRIWEANVIDGIVSMTLIFVLMSGALAADMEADGDTLGTIGMIAFCLFCATLGVTIIYCLIIKFKPANMFDYFVCHHKADAAGQARLVKVLFRTGDIRRCLSTLMISRSWTSSLTTSKPT